MLKQIIKAAGPATIVLAAASAMPAAAQTDTQQADTQQADPVQTDVRADTRQVEGEAKLAKHLEGRVAGEPVDCISLSQIHSSQIIDRTAIVYDAGSVIYVNRPEAGAESLRRGEIMVTEPTSNRLCSVDTVTMIDNTSGIYSGNVFLGEFVPYRKPDAKG